MNNSSILDLIVENKDVNSELEVKEKSKEISNKEEIIFNILKKVISENEFKKLKEKLEKIFMEMHIFIEDSNEISYKIGMVDSYKLQDELKNSVAERTKICDLVNRKKNNKTNINNDDILSLIFEDHVAKIAELTDEDKNAMKDILNDIDIDNTFSHLSEDDRKKIKEIILLEDENASIQMSYLCEKYWRDGVKYAKAIINI